MKVSTNRPQRCHSLVVWVWVWEGGKRKISREECVALNGMAEEICNQLEGF